jgi:hypothetical protein
MSAQSPAREECAVPRNISWEWHHDLYDRHYWLILKDANSGAMLYYQLGRDPTDEQIQSAVNQFLEAVLEYPNAEQADGCIRH